MLCESHPFKAVGCYWEESLLLQPYNRPSVDVYRQTHHILIFRGFDGLQLRL